MFGIEINRNIKCSLSCQFCEQLRSRIIDGSIPGGIRLPSTRVLSKEYAVSRNIIIEVYEQLQAEGYLDIRIDMDLRKTISGYLYRSKGISAEPERIMITSGITDACLLLSCHFKKDFGRIVIEDPSWNKLRDIFLNNDYKIYPVKTDQEGICVNEMGNKPKKSLILVTPSHQYPTGSILSIQRRIMLIDRANESDSFILENDYDGEFRLKGASIPPLYNLSGERVIYMATFSKCLFPGIRLGYIVVPYRLIEKLRDTKKHLSMMPSSILQRTVLHFFKEGYFERHILKMKKIYTAKRTFLEHKIPEILGQNAMIGKNAAGVFLTLNFQASSRIDWRQTVNYGISIRSFEKFSLSQENYGNKIVLGYGNLTENQMNEGLLRLKKFIDVNLKS